MLFWLTFAITVILIWLCTRPASYRYEQKHQDTYRAMCDYVYNNKPLDKKMKYFKRMYEFYKKLDDWKELCCILRVCFGCGLVILGFILVGNYSTAEAEIQKHEARYSIIMCQLETDMYSYYNSYTNDDTVFVDSGIKIEKDSKGNVINESIVIGGYGQRELMEDISNWNSWLAGRNVMENNFWVGIFYPKFSDRLNFVVIEWEPAYNIMLY